MESELFFRGIHFIMFRKNDSHCRPKSQPGADLKTEHTVINFVVLSTELRILATSCPAGIPVGQDASKISNYYYYHYY